MEIVRLKAEHYDALLALLNLAFTRKNKREMDFLRDIPKMWVRDDAHMGKHIGIFEGGRLVAAMGIYPFDAFVGGVPLRFATTGNIAVHPDVEGRGLMGAMMDYAMEELDRLGVDVARLGGLRSRYNRYGFESCGQVYTFNFTEKNRQRRLPLAGRGVTFRQMSAEDTEALDFAAALYNRGAIAVPRTAEGAWLAMTTWQNTPYLALCDGTPIGYVVANTQGNVIAELAAKDTATLADTVAAWQARVGASISFSLPPYAVEAVRLFSQVCESSAIQSPSHFRVIHWDKLIGALLALKLSYCRLPEGTLCLDILGWGRVRLTVKEGVATCERTEDTADITLDPLAAARYIFGPYPPVCTAEAPPVATAWFPLPLSWNGQDRV